MILLKIFLYILLGIAVLLGLLLSMRLKLYIKTGDSFELRAGLGFVVFSLTPKKKKSKIDLSDFTYEKHMKRLEKERAKSEKKSRRKKMKALAKNAKEVSEKESDDEKNGGSVKKFTLESIIEIIEFVLDEFPRFTSCIDTEIKKLDIEVAGRDAADCAVKYGVISQLTGYLIEILASGTSMRALKSDSISVRANFLGEKTVYKIDIRLRLRLFSVLCVGLHALFRFIRMKIKQ